MGHHRYMNMVVAILVATAQIQYRYSTRYKPDTLTGMNKYDYPAIEFKIMQLMLFYGGV